MLVAKEVPLCPQGGTSHTAMFFLQHMDIYHTVFSVPDSAVLIAAKFNWCKENIRDEVS